MPKERRHLPIAQDAEFVIRNIVSKEPASVLAEEFRVQPTLIYNWVN